MSVRAAHGGLARPARQTAASAAAAGGAREWRRGRRWRMRLRRHRRLGRLRRRTGRGVGCDDLLAAAATVAEQWTVAARLVAAALNHPRGGRSEASSAPIRRPLSHGSADGSGEGPLPLARHRWRTVEWQRHVHWCQLRRRLHRELPAVSTCPPGRSVGVRCGRPSWSIAGPQTTSPTSRLSAGHEQRHDARRKLRARLRRKPNKTATLVAAI